MLAARLALMMFLAVIAMRAQGANGWRLVWSDEFNGPAGTPPDPAKWNRNLGAGGWGNAELENYTNDIRNAFQDGKGNLVIRAVRDASGNYTSARLLTGSPSASTRTADSSWQYGWIEARIKVPSAQGVWPSFWAMGEDIAAVGWPLCGEVDIMENFGTFNDNAFVNNATANGPGYAGVTGKVYRLPWGQRVADDFHVFAIQWSQDSLEWYLDGVSYYKVTPASIPAGTQWVFNNPFFILLNLAIAGPGTVATAADGNESLLGTPDPNAPFPAQDMLVDYVRVYQAEPLGPRTPSITPGRVVNAASYLGAIAPGSLAVVYGNNFADGAYNASPIDGKFPTFISGLTVNVNGVNAPIIYVSGTQINFQVPWGLTLDLAASVRVTRDGVASDVETISVSALTSPAPFPREYQDGVALMSGVGCQEPVCAVRAGGTYTLWVNGLGPKNGPAEDGVPARSDGGVWPLEVPDGPASCQLVIGGQPAWVDYCGAAPGLIIDQLNFEYPSGVATDHPFVDASLTIGGVTARFRLPAPKPSESGAAGLIN
jgi:uncharacterized protein (TIGR03437 family)